MKDKTYCPYCGSANLVKNQIQCIETQDFCVPTFKCNLCKKIFTDLSIQNSEQTEDLQTTLNNVKNGKRLSKKRSTSH